MSRGYKPSWQPGDSKFICDCCGFLRKRSEGKMRWDMFFVCADTCWEPRQPQDFIRTVVGEGRAVQPSRPEQPDEFSTSAEALPEPEPPIT